MLPFVLFCFGWLKWFFALPLVGLCVFCFVLMLKHAPPLWVPQINQNNVLRFLIIALLVGLWVWFSGIGRFTYQSEDHTVRNAIFRMLVQRSWPIVEATPPPQFFNRPVAFVYYFGFWLPPALVGKAFGFAAGNFAQVVWAFCGVMLFYWLVLASGLKKMAIWPLVLFMFFSGMDWLGASLIKQHAVNVVTATPHLDNWADYFQFSSFTTQLYWVYNQAIAGWLATMLLYVQKNNRCLAFIAGITFISGTLPAIGLVPIGFCIAVRNWRSQNKRFALLPFLADVITPENLTGLLFTAISYMFLGSNNNGQKLGSLFHVFRDIWWLYLLFLFCEVFVLFALIAPYQNKNPMFYLIALIFIFAPFVRINDKADFSMRATIPALVILFLMVCRGLQQSFVKKNKAVFAALIAVLIMGSATAQTEIVRSVALTRIMKKTGAVVTEEWQPMEVIWRNNFYAYMDNKLFFKYLMR